MSFGYYSGKISSFLSLNDKSKLLGINKTWKKNIMSEIKKEEKKLIHFIKKNFKDEVIELPYMFSQLNKVNNIIRKKKISKTKLLMKAFTKNLSNNHSYVFNYKDWVNMGNSYIIALTYLSMGYSAVLVYLYKKGTFEIKYYGGSNGLDAQHNANEIIQLKDGSIKNIYEALDIIMDRNKIHKYLKKI